MNLKEIAAVSGKSGLYKVVKPTRNGVILESIDDKKAKHVAGPNSRVSILKEISIYTTDEDGTVLLEDVFVSMKKEFGSEFKLDSKPTDADLYEFIGKIVPNYDEERVYSSDIKKLISWFNLLSKHYPDLFEDSPEEETKETVSED